MRPANLFCPRCGTAAPDDVSASPLGLWEQGSYGGGNPDRDRLIGGDGPRESPSQSRSQTLMLIGGAIAALALIWLLIRPADEPAIDESAVDETGDESAIDDPAIEDIGGSAEGLDDAAPAEADGLPDQGPLSAEALPVGPAFEAEVRYADPGSEPVVGELTGLGLVTGNNDVGLPLQLLVLDSGERIVLSGIRGIPVAAHGSTILVQLGDVLSAVDLSQPELTSVPLVEARNGSVQVVGFESGPGEQDPETDQEGETVGPVVWTLVVPFSSTLPARLESYSLAGRPLDRVPLGPYAIQSGALDLVYNPAGGIYRRTGDDFVRLSAGRTLAAGEGLVLVHECDDAMVCGPQWFTRAGWSPVDLPLPEGLVDGDRYYEIAGRDRWLTISDLGERTATLSDIATGEIVWRWLWPQWGGPAGFGPPVSGDGRWLVDFSSIRPDGLGPISVIADLENNAVWGLDHAFGRNPVATLIDLGDTPFGQGVG